MRKLKAFLPFLIIFAIIAVFILGMHGFYEAAGDKDVSFWGALYAVLCMFIMESADPNIANWQLVAANYIAAMVLGYSIFIIVYNYAYTGWMLFKIKYFYKNHYIIFGVGEMGFRMALELLKTGHKVVAVEKNPDNEHIRKISSLGAFVIVGSAFEREDLLKAGIATAGNCLVLTGNDENNLRAANLISFLNQQGVLKNPLRVQIHVSDWYNNNFLKDYMDMYNKTGTFDMDTFSVDKAAAQIIYDAYSPMQKAEYVPIISPDGRVREVEVKENVIVIVGFNLTAESFIMENIILSHGPGLKNVKILLIERNVENCVKELHFKFPFLADYLDLIPVELINEDFYGSPYTDADFLAQIENASAAYFFGEHDAYLMGLANNFRQMLYAEFGDLEKTPIVVCLPEHSEVLQLLDPKTFQSEGEDVALFETFKDKFNIHIIKLITDTCTKGKLIDEAGLVTVLSQIVNYFYSVKYEFDYLLTEAEKKKLPEGFIADLESKYINIDFQTDRPEVELEDSILGALGKHLEKPKSVLQKTFGMKARWDSLPDIKQESNRYVARHLDVKVDFLRKMGYEDFRYEVIDKFFPVLAPIEHKRWCAEKLAFNFKFGHFPQRNNSLKKLLKDTLKVHDQLIDYDELTQEMKDKDFNMFLLINVLRKVREAYVL